ncbi:hypothetical protein ILUMI_17885 [Ignelater luminosus]|uniref:Uncharacterized protein n=1 Tax=Ignelater luminosus TaxID=2038154 RepID=A0A8K0CPN7_IGNLU|nr:hypothetical protein ILUMI_17885 [Ignelater luminosus]
MSLLVDIPKAGFGSTNDGNTSREFFHVPNLSAEITSSYISPESNSRSHIKIMPGNLAESRVTLMFSSDPLLTGMRHVPRKATKPFLKETLEMLPSAESTQSMVDVPDEEGWIIKTKES